MDPELIAIMYALAGGTVCGIKKEDDDEGGGGGDDDKKFSQKELNALLAKERKAIEAKFDAKLKDLDGLSEKAKEADDLKAKLAQLEQEKLEAGKTAEEKARMRAEADQKRAADERAAIAKERDDHKADAEKTRGEFKQHRIRTALTGALLKAKAFPEFVEDAVEALTRGAEIEFDDKSGKITGITYGEARYTDTKSAADAFLKAKPIYQEHPGGGSGNNRPSGGGALGKNWKDMTPDELASAGWNTPPTPARGGGAEPTLDDD